MSKSGSWPWHGRHAISVKSKRANSDVRSPASLGDLIFFDPVSLFLLAAFPRWTTLSAPVSPSSTEENGIGTTFLWDMECQWCLVTSGDRDEPPPSSIRSCSWCSSSNIFLTFELLLLPPVVMGISVMWVDDPYFYLILLFCVCVCSRYSSWRREKEMPGRIADPFACHCHSFASCVSHVDDAESDWLSTQFQSDEINENEENEWSVTAPLVQHFSPYM